MSEGQCVLDSRVVQERILCCVVCLGSGLVVGETGAILLSKLVEMLPAMHLEEANEAIVHVGIALWFDRQPRRLSADWRTDSP